ncbi:MAG: acyltransferase [Bdellovibrionales bacterium]|nr:acyltransferase [Bdellovibrionales bacterium]
MTVKKPKSFLGKVLYVVLHRRAHLYGSIRGFALFTLAAFSRSIFSLKQVRLGRNVRLQKNKSVMAEPTASIEIGDDTIIYENAKIEAYQNGKIKIGKESVLGDIKIVSKYGITIGERFLSSWNVFIEDFDPHPIDPELRALQVRDLVQNFRPRFAAPSSPPVQEEWASRGWNFPGEPIVIGNDVWVGANVTILKGAKIGNGCVVATGSVVVRGDYPDRSVLAGSPAKVIKQIEK